MSYCVNCGVELDRSLKKCPLCETPVVNPNDVAAEEPIITTYPVEQMEKIVKKLRLISANLVTAIFLTGLILCPLCDFIINDALTWSKYVIPSVILAWCCAVPPIIIKRKPLLKCMMADFAAVFAYLAVMNFLTTPRQNWFAHICIPILLYLFGSFILLYTLSAKKTNVLYIVSIGFVLSGIFCMLTEYFVRKFRLLEIEFVWSLPALISCIGVAALLIIISRLSKISAIRKRLHI